MFKTVLVANRGEIAVRIIRTLQAMGIRAVAVCSDADQGSLHVAMADIAVHLPGNAPADTYLRGDLILAAAREHGASAVIPGYGFLAENADFAAACAAAGLSFIGPTPEQIRQFGLKHRSRELALAAGVPLVPGSGLLANLNEAQSEAARIGYPVMLKSTAGGGGIGMTRCADPAQLAEAFETVRRQALNFFQDAGVFLECCIDDARHVEVQIFGDGLGRVVALGERDCSLQRRNQKVVEETPAPDLPAATRSAMMAAAERLGAAVGYQSAGTVEFIYDRARDAFYFLEVNTRLQVEHPVTEAVLGIDLVEWMILTAAGTPPDLTTLPAPKGHAIEVRIYAEDPVHDFQPSAGELTEVRFPTYIRLDSWVATGTVVSPWYDPMIAKLVVHGASRDEAIRHMQAALAESRIGGIASNIDYLRQVTGSEMFASGQVSTRALSRFPYAPNVIEIVAPGTYSTIQDCPGRMGLWHIGVPPSGPMDAFAFRMANRIVGNSPDSAGIECTIAGPVVKFHADGLFALTGAACPATLDGAPVPLWTPVPVKAGQELVTGKALSGCRLYLAVQGGLDVPLYLGSRSTFVLGKFGGHTGRVLQRGDVIALGQSAALPAAPAPAALIPAYGSHWEVGVTYGPHGAPDFFTPEAVEMFFATDWEVHYNSNRLGVRLIGPKPEWARSDGGEAGLHPSNIHDTEYAIGAINFTGDMPVILTQDGPSLGGFVCPATIVQAELWKIGQARPGDTIRFVPMGFDDALALERAQDAAIQSLTPPATLPARIAPSLAPTAMVSATVIAWRPATADRPAVAYRQAGDKYILLEYGPNELDLRYRFRIHALMEALKAAPIHGILELSPGVRSLQVHYDGRVIHQRDLIAALMMAEDNLPDIASMKLATRVIHMPMAFEDSATLDAQTRYMETVRANAPWMPNNVDFIQRINGLASREEVKRIAYEASYMVMGLGDVYLGAPCAVPIDPRHRLLTSKYNPARTFTAEGTVGIGGVYMCIYGMDSPGGYQLIGRTLPIWNKFTRNASFTPGEPWLLRFFDQVRFYEVTEAELDRLREDFRQGLAGVRIEEEIFDLAAYHAFLEAEAGSIAAFKTSQQAAFTAEVARWQEDEPLAPAEDSVPPEDSEAAGEPLLAELHGSVWKVLVEEGQTVNAGDTVAILEAMKTEITVTAPVSGTIARIHARPGRTVATGDRLLVIAAA